MTDTQNFNLVPNDGEEEFIVDFGEVTQVSTSDFNKLQNRPSYAGVVMTGDTNIPQVPNKTSQLANDSDYQDGSQVEATVGSAIATEKGSREQADAGLQGQIDTLSSTKADKSNTYTKTEVDSALAAKQGTLTAGDNVTIDANNTISATDTTYTAGNGLTLTGTEFNADTSVLQEKLTAGDNVVIDANNIISATDTTYTAFTGTNGQATGTAGLVPAPATSDVGKVLGANGDWVNIPATFTTNEWNALWA